MPQHGVLHHWHHGKLLASPRESIPLRHPKLGHTLSAIYLTRAVIFPLSHSGKSSLNGSPETGPQLLA